MLRKFLQQFSSARTSHKYIVDIDKVLCTGEYHRLMEITQSNGFGSLISNDVEASYEQCTDVAGGDLVLRQLNLEAQLLISHAELISQLEDEVQDFPEHASCSCERLHQRKSLTRVNLSDELSHDVWPQLKSYTLEQPPDAGDHVLFMCKYCRHMIKQNKLPPRCVINGLQVVPMPPELSALDSLSIQLIQRAKYYQTIVRLGTYTGKVPIYNSLKACKGTVFYLPLPLNKTLETLDQVMHDDSTLPEPSYTSL